MKKKLTLYILFLITVTFFIFLSDESRKPLVLNGSDMRRESGSVSDTISYISEDSAYSGLFLKTTNYMLEKGAYRIGIEYKSEANANSLVITDNGHTLQTESLITDNTYIEYPFTLEKDSQEVIFSIHYAGTGTLTVQSFRLIPEGRFYQDSFFFAALFLLLNLIGFLCYQKLQKTQGSAPTTMTLFFLFCIGFAACIPYFNSYLNWGDDLCYHLTRIEGIKDGILDGQFPVVIYPEGLKGNGYLNCMYPNFFLYLPAFFRILGVSMASSYKVLVFLFHFATAGITYYSIKSISGNRKTALLASLLYTLCPYRFTNFYARGAVGEALAMTFFPLLLAGLYHVLLGNRKKWPLLVLGLSGLIQTHVLSAVLGAILCVLFGVIYIIKVITEKRYFEIIKAAIVTLLLNLWFIVPFLYFYKKGNLDTGALDWCSFSEYSLSLSGLFGTINTGDYRTLALGLPIAICAAIAFFYFFAERKSLDKLSGFCLMLFILGLISTFMATNLFPGFEFLDMGMMAKFLTNIQFAWRMLGPASILLITAGCILLFQSSLLGEYQKGIFILLAGITLLATTKYRDSDFAYATYTSTYSIGHASKVNGIPKGDNTIVYPYEWTPVGSNSFDPPTETIFSEENAVTVLSQTRTGTTTSLRYSTATPNMTATFPLICYNGYAAYEDGKQIPLLENTESAVKVALTGDGTPHEITIQYKGKGIFTIAFMISLLTTCGCILYKVKWKGRK